MNDAEREESRQAIETTSRLTAVKTRLYGVLLPTSPWAFKDDVQWLVDEVLGQRRLLDQYGFMYEVYGFVHRGNCPSGMEHESECTCGLRDDIKKLERLGAPSE